MTNTKLMRAVCFSLIVVLLPLVTHAQTPERRNVIVVTLDGLRWQELFRGADPDLSNSAYVTHPEAIQKFFGASAAERRRSLMPFLWEVVAENGQLHGNRDLKNKVNCTNHRLISYPGYSEMLVGFRHSRVSSNRKKDNPHATVFEFLNNDPQFNGEVAAFATWDVFPYIFRESTSGIHINAGSDRAHGDISKNEQLLNKLQTERGARTDSLTFQYAMAYLARKRPRVVFIGFDATDHYAHRGRYGEYLKAANTADSMIAHLWHWVQSQPDYRDQTTLFITTDHGRGNGEHNWRKHRLLVAGSRHIWFAVIGPYTPSLGEMRLKATAYQKQVARTVAAFVGIRYDNVRKVGEVLEPMIVTAEEARPETAKLR